MQSIKEIAIIGTGQMGMGLVECAALSGFRVQFIKATPGSLDKAVNGFTKTLAKRTQKGKISQKEEEVARENVTILNNFDSLKNADLVIETVLEDVSVKLELLPRLEAAMNDSAILATNTSSLNLNTLAGCLTKPERFIGLHFFNPVPAMKLVELSVFSNTPENVSAAARTVCKSLGKTVVSVKESPGYVVNRLLMPYILHSIETLEYGVAEANSIDEAMKLGCGHPMGPLALADFVGLDVVLAIAQALNGELKDSRFRIPSLLRKLVSDGHCGRKTGLGIYDYSSSTPTVNPSVQI